MNSQSVTKHALANGDLSLVPSDEERMLRDAVAGIAGGFGPDYFRRTTAEGKSATELWDALAARG